MRLERLRARLTDPWTWALLVLAVVVVRFGYSLAIRDMVPSDEGYLLSQALDMVRGKVLYRDMDAFVTPGAWFAIAGLFRFVDPSIWASRMLALAGYLVMIAASWRIVADQADRRWACACVAGLLVMSVWAFRAWNWAFYSPFAVAFVLAALERLLAWRRESRPRDLYLAGALLGAAILFKQNYGAYALLGTLLMLAAVQVERAGLRRAAASAAAGDGSRVLLGMALAGAPVVAYFGYYGALASVVRSLLFHPFEFAGKHDIPYLPLSRLWADQAFQGFIDRLTYGAYPLYKTPDPPRWIMDAQLVERLHVLLYWLPPLVFATGLALALAAARRRAGRLVDAGLLGTTAVCGLVFLGVFPRADFNHLLHVYQPVVVAGFVTAHALWQSLAPRSWLWEKALKGAAVFLVVAYGGVAIVWYAALVHWRDTELTPRRAGIYLTALEASSMEQTLERIEAEIGPEEALLTVPDLAMLNFLAERPVPSAYYNLYEHHIGHDGGKAVVEGAEASQVRLAVAAYDDFFSDRVGLREFAPQLADYLRSHFEIAYAAKNDSMVFYRRRGEPLLVERQPVLVYCDVPEEAMFGPRVVRHHLLFDSLYLDVGAEGSAFETIEVRCQIRVPDSSELVVRIGYREPMAATPGAFVLTGIQVADGSEERHLVLERQPVNVREGFFYDARPERRFDLSEWAGREVEVVFQARRVGAVHMGPFDLRGFAAVFEDPHLEIGAQPERGARQTASRSRQEGSTGPMGK